VQQAISNAYSRGILKAEQQAVYLKGQLGYVLMQRSEYARAIKVFEAAIAGAESFYRNKSSEHDQSVETPLVKLQYEFQSLIVDWHIEIIKAMSALENFKGVTEHMQNMQSFHSELSSEASYKLRSAKITAWRRMAKYSDASNELAALTNEAHSDAGRLDASLQHGQLLSHFRWSSSEAETHLKEAYKLCCKPEVAGKDSAKAADVLCNLAHAIRRQHRVIEAEQLYRDSLSVLTIQEADQSHLKTLSSRMNLGVVIACQGRFEEAQRELEEVVACHKKATEDRAFHPKLALALTFLGNVMRHNSKNSVRECEEKYERALEIYEHNLGTGWGDHTTVHNEVAWVKTQLGIIKMDKPKPELETARRLFEEALAINTTIFEPLQATDVEYTANYASDVHASALASSVSHLHPTVGIGCMYIGSVEQAHGEFQKALRDFKKALQIFIASGFEEGKMWAEIAISRCEQSNKRRVLDPRETFPVFFSRWLSDGNKQDPPELCWREIYAASDD